MYSHHVDALTAFSLGQGYIGRAYQVRKRLGATLLYSRGSLIGGSWWLWMFLVPITERNCAKAIIRSAWEIFPKAIVWQPKAWLQAVAINLLAVLFVCAWLFGMGCVLVFFMTMGTCTFHKY